MPAQFTNGYALLVAVDENSVSRLALPVVGKDVAALEEILTHPERCAYPRENVKVIKGQDATRYGILDGLAWLTERLAADASDNATAVIYYSGHGWRVAGASSSTYYLIPYDFRETAARVSALPAADFADAIEGLRPRRLLVLLDCCHAGGMDVKALAPTRSDQFFAPGSMASAIPSTLFMAGEQTRTGESGAKNLDLLAQGAGRAVLSSSRGEQTSYYRKDGAMSIFTYHLIEALTGHAQPAEDAEDVRVFNLGDHVDRRVPVSARAEWGAQQAPDFQISGNFPVAMLLGGKGLARGMAAPDPLVPLTAVEPQASTRIDTGGGDIVGGDKITVGDVRGSGIAIGRGAQAHVGGKD